MLKSITSLSFGIVVLGACVLIARADDSTKPAAKPLVAAEVKLGRPVDFGKDIYPILEANCIACHNDGVPESKLSVEDLAGIMKGGKRGASVVPKEPEKSLLYQVVTRAHAPAMPPLPNKVDAEALTPEQLGLMKLWITEGATGPGSSASTSKINWQPISTSLNAIYSAALSPWGRFAAVGRANRLTIYDVLTGEEAAKLVDPNLSSIQFEGKPMYPEGAAHRDFVHSLAFSPDGTMLASGGYRVVKLWKRAQNVQKLQAALPVAGTKLIVTADGKTAAFAAADNSIVLLNVADGKPIRTLTGHGAVVKGMAFTADGSKLVSGSLDKSIRVWTVADGKLIGQVNTPAPVNDIALTADAAQVLSADADNVLRLWATPAAVPAAGAAPVAAVREFKGHEKPATAVAIILPAGTLVASGSEDGTVRIWQLADAKQTQSMAQGAPVTAIATRPDGQLIASVGANNIVRLWQTADAKQRAEFKGDQRAQRVVVQKTESQAVARQQFTLADAAMKAGEKELTERQEGLKKANEGKVAADKALTDAQAKEKPAIEAQNAAKAALDKKPDDAALKKAFEDAMKAAVAATEVVKGATNGQASAVRGVQASEMAVKNGTDRVAQLKTAREASEAAQKQSDADLAKVQGEATAAEKPIRALAFSADGKKLLTAGDDQLVQLWDGNRGLPLETFAGHAAPAVGAAFAGATPVSASADQKLIVWDANPAWTLAGQLGPKADAPLELGPSPFVGRILALDFSDDGKLLATGGGDPSRSGELLVWDVEKLAVVKEFKDAHSDTVLGVDFSHDGKFLLTGAADKFVKIFDVATGKHVRSFEGHTHHVLDVTWKADGATIASAGADNQIKIWNVDTGEQARTIAGYNKQVTAIQFMGVGENTISCSGDATVRFHKSSDGANYRSFAGAVDYVYAAAASRDESIVIAGGEDGTLRVWNGATGEVLQTFAPPKPADKGAQANAAPAK